ncbi:amino acid ABC transporter substrate-binding protein [Asanoa ishikariensis]|uniref:Amino acid/amide ABC transporter substrate-binding protein, HAAT family n=1 Tax=Asanoa ishikariensis TaxID=137265 RepID=A0A1H3UFE6_9ACTN|nr:ABC transporter substrate-binding protein [Asanoa ishikariensis]GIF63644.1 amino acid ABC transporter substrate-binding protein [Asanoa ishikariensis]SDZ61153.1 amino acid/amide ABC transporter substrate-binding protein, HAAT family [Asanoa ishikariensis]
MRKTWTLSLALALPLALAACGGSAPAGTTNGGGGQSGGTIKIGSLHPLSGSSAADGQQMDNGAKLAVEAINDAGGIKSQGGKKLELVSADTQGKPEVGQSEAQRLIQEGAVGLVGTYQSAVSANVSTVAERNKVPFVIDVSSADSILAQGYKNTFRVQPSSTVLGTSGAQFLDQVSKAAGKPVKSVAILHEQGPFGTAVRDAFKAEAEKSGIKVGPAIAYDAASVSDLTTQVTQVKASGADVLMVAGYYRDGVLAAKAVDTVKPALNAVYGVANGAFDLPQFPKEVGAAGEGYFDANYHADMTKPDMQALAQLYQSKYNDAIRTGAVLAYDSVQVIAAALEKAGSAEPAKVRDAIASGEVPTLIAGPGTIKFGPTGENLNATPILMQVQGGAPKQVFPADKAEAQPVYPAFKSQ